MYNFKPKPNKAWISVRTIRRNAVGPIHVRITEEIPPPNPLPQQLAGVVATEGFWRTLSSVFLIDRSRFPQAGGYEVKAATPYRLEITGRDGIDQTINADVNVLYTFTDGAIIDFTATL